MLYFCRDYDFFTPTPARSSLFRSACISAPSPLPHKWRRHLWTTPKYALQKSSRHSFRNYFSLSNLWLISTQSQNRKFILKHELRNVTRDSLHVTQWWCNSSVGFRICLYIVLQLKQCSIVIHIVIFQAKSILAKVFQEKLTNFTIKITKLVNFSWIKIPKRPWFQMLL